jgi:hypothetical protein
MSQEDVQAMESALKRVKDLNRRLAEVNAAVKQSKLISLILTLLLVVAAIGGVYNLLRPFISAYQNPKPYQDAFLTELQTNVMPEVQRQMQEVLSTTGRDVLKLSVDRFLERREDLQRAVEAETALLMADLGEFAEKTLADQVVNFEVKVTETFARIAPQLNDPEKRDVIIGNASVALEAAVRRIVNDRLSDHINSLLHIEQMLLDYPVPEELKAMSDTELQQKLLDDLSAYAIATLKRTIGPETKQFLRELSE